MADVRGRRILRLLNDPELQGDLLLVGMALSAWLDLGHTSRTFYAVARDLWPKSRHQMLRLTEAIASDVRTYRPPDAPTDCRAPMQRRAGLCGQRAREVHIWLPDGTVGAIVTDRVTGEWGPISACARHVEWAQQKLRESYTDKPNDIPLPLANSGGLLAKHFPELNWYRLYATFDPYWQQHPEVKPWPKPTLEVVIGGGEALNEPRPSLTVLPGAS